MNKRIKLFEMYVKHHDIQLSYITKSKRYVYCLASTYSFNFNRMQCKMCKVKEICNISSKGLTIEDMTYIRKKYPEYFI